MSAAGGASMRAAFDVTAMISGRTGIARYVSELAQALEHQGVELLRFAVGRAAFAAPPGTRRLPVPARWVAPWWRAVPWPSAEQLSGGGDIVHATGLVVPPTSRPLVVTVHDVSALLYPELHPDRQVRQSRGQLAALERAEVILTVSQATAEDLVGLGIRRDRIVVAPLGATPLAEPEPLTGLPGLYLLTVGETSPRKRYHVLLRALSRIEPGLDLVMAGPPAADERRLCDLAMQLGVAPRLRRLGAVSDGELAALYRGALALCFSSVAEGFGLPVLEAMSAGLPVIASDIPAMRELLGEGAMYVSGEDPDDWAHAINALAGDAGLRERLSGAGRARAADYTWDRTAAVTVEAYRRAVAVAGQP